MADDQTDLLGQAVALAQALAEENETLRNTNRRLRLALALGLRQSPKKRGGRPRKEERGLSDLTSFEARKAQQSLKKRRRVSDKEILTAMLREELAKSGKRLPSTPKVRAVIKTLSNRVSASRQASKKASQKTD